MTETLLPTDYAIIAVGQTESANFPLILVVGRENNGDALIVPGIGIYDETVSSGSAFWNRAYTFLQRITRWNGHLRRDCIAKNLSPVIFTNAYPRPIPNSRTNKHQIRASVDDDEIRRHVDSIFSLEISSRIQAVVFSTGKSTVFDRPRILIEQECNKRQIPFMEAPYFASQGMPNAYLDSALSEMELAVIVTIFKEFRAHTQQDAQADGPAARGSAA